MAAAVALFLGISLLYTKVIAPSSARAIEWRDLTAEVGPIQFATQTISIIRDRKKLVKLLHIVQPLGAPVPKAPPVDFAHRLAIMFAVGPRSSAGYVLHVASVTDHGDHVDVVFREQTPSLGDHVTAKLTYPYKLITIPKTDEALHFELVGRP